MVRYYVVLFVFLVFSVWEAGLAAASDEGKHQALLQLPPDPISFQSGPGSDLANSYCLICHSADYIYTQPPHPRAQWSDIVTKMKSAFGCPIPDEQISSLVDYLFIQNSIQPFPEKPSVRPINRSEASGTTSDQAGDPQHGKALYKKHCVTCHGTGGKGDSPIGQALIPPAADLTQLGKISDKAVLEAIRNGRPGTAMPSWKNDLNHSDINDLLSFLRTLTP